jgi:hypothetical protein
MVLDDGTTYTGLSGCAIVRLPDEVDITSPEEVQAWVDDNDSWEYRFETTEDRGKTVPYIIRNGDSVDAGAVFNVERKPKSND